jgi:hypothetical protein
MTILIFMSNEQGKEKEVTELLRDLVWLNAVIATELIQITENSSAILRKSPPPDSCLRDHQSLRETALLIAERCRPGTALKEHLTNHQQDKSA